MPDRSRTTVWLIQVIIDGGQGFPVEALSFFISILCMRTVYFTP